MFEKYKTSVIGGTALLLILLTMILTWLTASWRYSAKISAMQVSYEKRLAEIDRIANQN